MGEKKGQVTGDWPAAGDVFPGHFLNVECRIGLRPRRWSVIREIAIKEGVKQDRPGICFATARAVEGDEEAEILIRHEM